MFNQIKAALDIRKDIPDAVGYDSYGPIAFPLPLEIRDAIPEDVTTQIDSLTLLSVRIDNYSSKTQHNIRVLFSGDWEFAPRFSFHRRDIKVKSEIRSEDKEILILEIPPNESLSIEIFNPSTGFNVEQVLLGDVAITKLMQKLAEAKRYPELAKFKFVSFALGLLAVVAITLIALLTWNKFTEHHKIEAANSGLLSCTPYVFENSVSHEAEIERKLKQAGPYLSGYIFYLNKVDSLDELKLKDELILCDPAKL
ncbi:hypothetical protein HA051_01670 [Chromobacterium vaccinii]|nr:hypothetical protein [Chromobacterium vaccinii]